MDLAVAVECLERLRRFLVAWADDPVPRYGQPRLVGPSLSTVSHRRPMAARVTLVAGRWWALTLATAAGHCDRTVVPTAAWATVERSLDPKPSVIMLPDMERRALGALETTTAEGLEVVTGLPDGEARQEQMRRAAAAVEILPPPASAHAGARVTRGVFPHRTTDARVAWPWGGRKHLGMASRSGFSLLRPPGKRTPSTRRETSPGRGTKAHHT